MALNDATLRLESSLALLGTNVNDQLTAISTEIQQLATAVANGGESSDIESRLNAAADKLDALRAQVTDSTSRMTADDAPATETPTDPNAPTG